MMAAESVAAKWEYSAMLHSTHVILSTAIKQIANCVALYSREERRETAGSLFPIYSMGKAMCLCTSISAPHRS